MTERTAQLEAANARLLREVEQRRLAEDAMRSNAQLLRAIVDNLPAVLYVKDVTGRYMLVNRRFEQIFHLSAASIFGKTDYDIFEKEQADAFRAMDDRVIAANDVQTEEETATQDDGTHAYLSVKAPLRNGSAGLMRCSAFPRTSPNARTPSGRSARSSSAWISWTGSPGPPVSIRT